MRQYGKKRVVVTGGAGFLGSHLCRRLLSDDCEVICVDNFYTGTRSNIAPLTDNPMFEVLRHDVTFPLYIEADEIYNLACPASPIQYQFDPVQTTKTSVHGAINMLGLAKRLKAKILQASTSEVYGDPAISPQAEDYWGHVNPIGPRSCYDEGESVVLRPSSLTTIASITFESKVLARIFNTYGPGMHPDDGRVVSTFIMQALRGEDITVFGDGLHTRSFCYVDDMIDGLVCLMASGDDLPGPVNLGSSEEHSMSDLAERVITLTGSSSRIVYRPLPEDDPARRPEATLARERLGWAPTVDLDDGLQRTIAYFRALEEH